MGVMNVNSAAEFMLDLEQVLCVSGHIFLQSYNVGVGLDIM